MRRSYSFFLVVSLVAVMLGGGLSVIHPSYAQQPPFADIEDGVEFSADDTRAAYLVSVLRYVTWPNEDARDTLTIGVLGPSSVYQLLSEVPLSRVRGKSVQVVELTRNSQIPQVDLVYVSPRISSSLEQILTLATRSNVLVVTEDRNVRERMMINIQVDRGSELVFQINEPRIQAAGLMPTRDLMLLRGRELDTVAAHLASIRDITAIQVSRQELLERNRDISAQLNQSRERIELLEQNLRERDDALRAQESSLEDKQQLMDSQQATLNALIAELQEQREVLLVREEQLVQIQRQLVESENRLREQEALLEEKEVQLLDKEREGDVLTQRIASNRDILSAQQQQLRDQRAALAEQAQLIENRERTIDRQREFLVYVVIALIAFVVLGALSLSLYVKKRRTASQLLDTLTELHDAQDKLVESEKMAALGNLVAGVAHEVNTPLGVALTATSMLNDRREQLATDVEAGQLTREQLNKFLGQAAESLSLTEKNLSRVARLISNFKQVAVDQMVTEQRSIDLGNYVEEIMSALSIELKRAHINYVIDIQGEITIETIPGAMAQILTNLVTNSIRHGYHPLEEGEKPQGGQPRGTITVRASRADGGQIRLTFCDDGIGMNETVLDKIFEPFFTTKRNQGGTGLGMPIVYNLVRQQLKGDISVRSKVGEGTCFDLTLPRRLSN
ncbi:phospho-acceptor domain-containing protein [Aliidiomarina maris]|uniref:histidine kinase n=1 Tax=Aliidiomarina maris TaxID=531312 RepID=A0A327X846_9GAMM|nr:phospho-acceptor domain-containing protein [Aliidiomarina maris]